MKNMLYIHLTTMILLVTKTISQDIGLIGYFADGCPTGWSSYTNLAGRFAVSVGSADNETYTVGDTGGEANHQLTTSEMPSHNHDYGNFKYLLQENSGGDSVGSVDNDGPSNEPDVTNKGQIQSQGSDEPHNNLPPYYALYACQKDSSALEARIEDAEQLLAQLYFYIYNKTDAPSDSPTNLPTNIPTQYPTNIPINSPSNYPTMNPTIYPTNIPTNNPNVDVTEISSSFSSTKPTINPSMISNEYPNQISTNSPTKTNTKDDYFTTIVVNQGDESNNGNNNSNTSISDTAIIILVSSLIVCCCCCILLIIFIFSGLYHKKTQKQIKSLTQHRSSISGIASRSDTGTKLDMSDRYLGDLLTQNRKKSIELQDTNANNNNNNTDNVFNDIHDIEIEDMYEGINQNDNNNIIVTDNGNNNNDDDDNDDNDDNNSVDGDHNTTGAISLSGAAGVMDKITPMGMGNEVDISNWIEWTQVNVFDWLKINLEDNGMNNDMIQPFLKEFKEQFVTGKVLYQIKTKNNLMSSFKNNFQNQSFGIWMVFCSLINDLPNK